MQVNYSLTISHSLSTVVRVTLWILALPFPALVPEADGSRVTPRSFSPERCCCPCRLVSKVKQFTVDIWMSKHTLRHKPGTITGLELESELS